MAGLIPQEVIQDLVERIDLVSFIDEHVPLKKQGHSFVACCPFHHEKSPSFNVNSKKQFYYCFGCGAGGNLISFAMQYLHLDFMDTLSLLAARAGVTLPQNDTIKRPPKKPHLFPLLEKINQFYQHHLRTSGHAANEYLAQRGLTKDIIERYQLGYAPSGWHTLEAQFTSDHADLLTTGMLVQQDNGKCYDRYRHRLMFPIHDKQGRLIGFGGRALEAEQQPKYLNSPETPLFHKGRELYGLYQAIPHLSDKHPIIVVEGYLDVIALAQHDIPYTVGTLGTATTTAHLQLLNKYSQHIVFCFDGDAAGQKAAWRALENALPLLQEGLDLKFMTLPAAHDPDSFIRQAGRSAFLELMSQAKPFNVFFFEVLSSNLVLHSLAGKTQLIQKTKPYLAQLPEGIYKNLLQDQLSRLTGIELDRLAKWLQEKNTPLPLQSTYQNTHQRSPLNLAIALLLQYPERLITLLPSLSVPTPLDPNIDPGVTILHQLVAQVMQHENPTTGLLIEPWRQTPWFATIQQLSGWEHLIPDALIEQTFTGVLDLLRRQFHESQIQFYLSKSRIQGLSDEEKKNLQDLLKNRHQPHVSQQSLFLD